MRFRKQLLAFLSVLVLGGATLGATLAAPSSQSTEGDGSEAPVTDAPEPKAYLGVAVRPLTESVRERLELPADMTGVVIVRAQGPAAEAGLQRADVILSAGGVAVASPEDLKEVVLSKSPGDVLSIEYYRDGASASVSVTLGERPQWGGGHANRVQNPFKRFLNGFPKAVDGSYRTLGDDGEVHLNEMAQGSITEVGAASLTIEKATGETATFDIGEDTTILLNGQTAELADLEEGTRAVVLSVDGEVKAVVVGAPQRHRRPGFGGQFGPRIERLEQHFGQLRERFGQLRDRMSRLHPPIEQPTADPASPPPADATAA